MMTIIKRKNNKKLYYKKYMINYDINIPKTNRYFLFVRFRILPRFWLENRLFNKNDLLYIQRKN